MSKIGYLSASVLAVGLMAPISWGAYMTSFEAPTFTNGQSAARDGWTVSSGVVVTNAVASDGTQSVMIPNVTDTKNNVRGFQKKFTAAESRSGDGTLTFDFMPGANAGQGNSPLVWFYFYGNGSDTDPSAKSQVYLYNNGASPYMRIGGTPSSNGNVSVPVGTWTMGQWNTMKVTIDPVQHTMTYNINGHDLTSIPVGTSVTHFGLFWAITDGYGDALYIDNVHLTPEPGSMALLGLVGGGLLMKRRKRNRVR